MSRRDAVMGADELQRVRALAGKTQVQMAETLGISERAYQRLESVKGCPITQPYVMALILAFKDEMAAVGYEYER